MHFRLLEDFLALAECGNFTRAAELRHSTQSAFSRRIQTLEHRLGAPLFERERNPIQLTREGELFRPFAQDLLRRFQEARESVLEEHRFQQRKVLIAATHSLALNILPLLLHRIEESCNNLSLHLFSSQFDACVQAVASGQCHFLLTYTHPAYPLILDPEQMTDVSIGRDTLVPVRSPGSQVRMQAGAISMPLLGYAPESGIGRILDAVLGKTLKERFNRAFESSYASVLKSMAVEGYGTAWLPLRDISSELESGLLQRTGPGDWDIPLDIRLFRQRETLRPPAEAVWEIANNLT